MSHGNVSLDKPKVLLIATTGVPAINIDGTTIHTALLVNLEKKIITSK